MPRRPFVLFVVFAAVVVLVAAGPARAQGSREVFQVRAAAEGGDANAQYQLGLWYDIGRGVERDDPAAVRWYRRAARQGHRAAQNNLGHLLAKGEGAPEDDAEAVMWFHRAAEQGSSAAQFSLGFHYYNGEGVAPDAAEAARWFRAASAQGVPTAQYNLATMYANGIGVPQDLVRAAMWLNLAGAEVEGLDLVRWRGDRQLVLEALSAQELLESQDLSVACINSNFTDCGEP